MSVMEIIIIALLGLGIYSQIRSDGATSGTTTTNPDGTTTTTPAAQRSGNSTVLLILLILVVVFVLHKMGYITIPFLK